MMKKVFLLALLISFWFPYVNVSAATINIPADYRTIQEAINASVDGDVIIVDDGVYYPNGPAGFDFSGKAITLKSKNGSVNCVIDSRRVGRAFYFHSEEDEQSVLMGFTIRNGYLPSNEGGGILCINSSPKIYNCVVTKNYSKAGGGIYVANASPVIENCTLSNNSTHGKGGGIYSNNNSQPKIINCRIVDNQALSAENAGGGGICSEGSASLIQSCTLYRNTSGYVGGGILIEDSDHDKIINCEITINSSSNSGGGIFIYDASPQVTNTTISNNKSNYGAGIYFYNNEFRDVQPLLSGSTISENKAGISGGGLICSKASPEVSHCSISSNTAVDWAGGIVLTDDSEPDFYECDILNNSSDPERGWGGGISCSIAHPSFTNCTIEGNSALVGGALYADWSRQKTIKIHNCAIATNQAYENGGAIWLQQSIIDFNNCTFNKNKSLSDAMAATMYLAYKATVQMKDSILWGDFLYPEIALMNDSILTVSYSDIQRGKNAVYVDQGSSLNWRNGVLDDDPRFVNGTYGDWYLSQRDSGDTYESPCVDSGSAGSDTICFQTPQGTQCMGELSTRTDGGQDTSTVDMGYHSHSKVDWEGLSKQVVPYVERRNGEKTLYKIRDEILSSGEVGKTIARIVYDNALELMRLCVLDPKAAMEIKTCLDDNLKTSLVYLVKDKIDQTKILFLPDDIIRLYRISSKIKKVASPKFQKDIEYLEKVLGVIKGKSIKEVKAILGDTKMAF